MILWRIYSDGASSGNPGDSGAGIIIFDPTGSEIHKDSFYLGKMTNNMAEYEGLLRALEKAKELRIRDLIAYTDSLLMANQVNGTYKINNGILREYATKVRSLSEFFDSFAIQYIPREQNRIADRLAKEGIKKGQTGGRPR